MATKLEIYGSNSDNNVDCSCGNSCELMDAGRSFLTALFSASQYRRWCKLKDALSFKSEPAFVKWLIDNSERSLSSPRKERDHDSSNTSQAHAYKRPLQHQDTSIPSIITLPKNALPLSTSNQKPGPAKTTRPAVMARKKSKGMKGDPIISQKTHDNITPSMILPYSAPSPSPSVTSLLSTNSSMFAHLESIFPNNVIVNDDDNDNDGGRAVCDNFDNTTQDSPSNIDVKTHLKNIKKEFLEKAQCAESQETFHPDSARDCGPKLQPHTATNMLNNIMLGVRNNSENVGTGDEDVQFLAYMIYNPEYNSATMQTAIPDQSNTIQTDVVPTVANEYSHKAQQRIPGSHSATAQPMQVDPLVQSPTSVSHVIDMHREQLISSGRINENEATNVPSGTTTQSMSEKQIAHSVANVSVTLTGHQPLTTTQAIRLLPSVAQTQNISITHTSNGIGLGKETSAATMNESVRDETALMQVTTQPQVVSSGAQIAAPISQIVTSALQIETSAQQVAVSAPEIAVSAPQAAATLLQVAATSARQVASSVPAATLQISSIGQTAANPSSSGQGVPGSAVNIIDTVSSSAVAAEDRDVDSDSSGWRVSITDKVTASRVYSCNYCSHSSKKLSNVQRHISRIHSTGTNMYKCDKCNYTTGQKIHYDEHLHKHTGTYPFQCALCQHRSLRKADLVKHYRYKHRNELMFVCDSCPYICTSDTDLKTHVTDAHSNT